jgi:plasmid rolling circle replication initiator protein Rep
MLQFLYTDDYTVEDPGTYNPCHFHVLMYIQADYFQIQRPKYTAKDYFEDFSTHGNSSHSRLQRLWWK